MKRYLICFLCLIVPLLAVGQTKDYYEEKQHEVRISIGSVNDDYYHYVWAYSNIYTSFPSDYPSYEMESQYFGPKKTIGVLSASYFYHPSWLNGRFSLGGAMSYSHFGQDIKLRLTENKIGDIKEYNMAFTPSVRYSWIAKPCFQFYSGIGVSLYYNSIKYKQDYFKNSYNEFEASFQLTPIGFSVGRDVFAFGEVNFGGRSGQIVGGVGYRF